MNSIKETRKCLFDKSGRSVIKRVKQLGMVATDIYESINFWEKLLGFQLRYRVKQDESEFALLIRPGYLVLSSN